MNNQWQEVSVSTTGSCSHAVTAMETAVGVLVKNSTVYINGNHNTLDGPKVVAASESMVFIPGAKLVPGEGGQVRIRNQ